MNKTQLGIAIVVVLLASLLFVSSRTAPETLAVDGANFVRMYENKSGAVLLDVRTESEFTEGHLAGAINIDFQSPAFISEVKKLDPEVPYFVYCRSGNRSQKAIAIMKNMGIKDIVELKGGIVGNMSSLTLVTKPVESASEYTVDTSDMVNGVSLISGTAQSKLSQKEIDGLVFMREEEKLARDVYTTLGAKWGLRMFSNITASEETHMNAVKTLLDRYGIPDPSRVDAVGTFQSPVFQKLYNELIEKGVRSQAEALVVGATVEDLDLRDLELFIKETSSPDILIVYENLARGSRNHLRAFVRNIEAGGGTYTPAYISEETFRSIIEGPQERGR